MIDGTTLQRVLKFNDDDIALNRAGKLSDAQKRRIRRDAFGALVFAIVAAIVAVGVLLLPDGTFVRPFLMKSFYFTVALVSALVAGGIYMREEKVIQSGVVKRATGIPSIEKRRSIFRMTVGEKELWVTRAMEVSILPGERYHVYYAEGSPILLSAELISPS